MGAEEGAIESIPGNVGRIAQAWVNVRGGDCVSSRCTSGIQKDGLRGLKPCWKQFFFFLKKASTTSQMWFSARDAHMCPGDFKTRLWFQTEMMHVVAQKEHSRAGRKAHIERTYVYVVASGSLKGKISQMVVVEDFESRPHEAVSFVVRRENEKKEGNEQKLPRALLGYSGGRLPGRNTKERGRE